MKRSGLVLAITSVSLLFFFSCRGVLKYQTNLEEHPPGCFNPNKTLRENMTVPKAFEEPFPNHTTEPFPEDLSVPEPFVQNNFMRICSEEPKFQSHFPEVCMIRRFRYYKPCQVFQSAITTNYCFPRPDVLIMENIIKTFSGIQRFGGEKQSLLNVVLHYYVPRIGWKNIKRLAVMFFFVQHGKRCIGLAINVTLNYSVTLQSKHLYNIFIRPFCMHCVALIN